MIEIFSCENSLLLHADDTDRWSEICLIPGWNTETIEEVLKALFEEDFDRYTCTSFATEMLYCEYTSHILPFAILLSGTIDDILQQAQNTPSRLAKVKVANFSLTETIFLCEKLFEMGFSLRLDFNQSWSLDDSLNLSHSFKPNTFDYFEEPTLDLKAFCKKTTQAVALDENLHSQAFWKLPQVKTIVLKPPFWGGVGDCLEISQKADKMGKELVLSNTFNTCLGIQSLMDFAGLLKKPLAPFGLGKLEFPITLQPMERVGALSFEPALK